MKFGGSVLNSKDNFQKMKDILIETENPYIIVVSAFSKVTRQLDDAARFAELGEISEAESMVKNLYHFHLDLSKSIIHNELQISEVEYILNKAFTRIRELIKGVFITQELTPRIQDLILSFG